MASSSSTPIRLIFDLGDVLFTWTSETQTSISPNILGKMLRTPIWEAYECGKISRAACYSRLGEEFSTPAEEISEAFSQARKSLTKNWLLVEEIKRMQADHKGSLQVIVMSNIGKEDYLAVRELHTDWSIFHRIFTSAEAGMRKPSLDFFFHVLSSIDADPKDCIFVDDKEENILSARSLGIHSIIFDSTENVIRQLRNLLGDPVERGNKYLEKNARKHFSTTNTGMNITDNFSRLLMLEAGCNADILSIEYHERTWNYFIGKPAGTTRSLPDDFDTTAIAWTINPGSSKAAKSILDEILTYINEDGIITTYFDRSRTRTDAVVCVNVIHMFYHYNYITPLCLPTQDYVVSVLQNRAYLNGTRYYTSPDAFLYFFSRLLSCPGAHTLRTSTLALLQKRILERVGAPGDAVELGMRLLAALNTQAGVAGMERVWESDLMKLRDLQCMDGGWEIGWLCKYGSSGVEIGNRGLCTAFAVKAIQGFEEEEVNSRNKRTAVLRRNS